MRGRELAHSVIPRALRGASGDNARVISPAPIATALSLLLSSPGGPLEGYKEIDVPTGKLFWRGWTEEDLRALTDQLPRVLAAVETRLETKLEATFATILVPGSLELRNLVEKMSGKLLDA